ncbi:hypothetical protein QVD17_07942 [Tagetes erecta]|uniref:Uncharacterized protein n=1 Tax=Tagetes erecta TaxID=13708 RepID=A0AAD8L1T9_TARER|nr:hypothetical protein QVD17_07942 [Tagetes erecta]
MFIDHNAYDIGPFHLDTSDMFDFVPVVLISNSTFFALFCFRPAILISLIMSSCFGIACNQFTSEKKTGCKGCFK